MNKLLSIKNLHKYYQSGEIILKVLEGLDLEVQQKEMIAIVGASGVGKTTLLNLIGALDTPNEGEILFEGKNIFEMPEQELANYRNKEIGFIFQFHYLLADFTAIENTIIPALLKGENKNEAFDKGMQLLKELNLDGKCFYRVGELSGGEQQRIAVARALINSPKLILADEPTGNLDERTANDMCNLLLKINETHNVSFIIATHNQKLAKICTNIFSLHLGKLNKIDKDYFQ